MTMSGERFRAACPPDPLGYSNPVTRRSMCSWVTKGEASVATTDLRSGWAKKHVLDTVDSGLLHSIYGSTEPCVVSDLPIY
jgi:hypothetical protein